MQPLDNPANTSVKHTPSGWMPFLRALLAAAALVVLLVLLLAGYVRWRGVRRPLPQDPDEALRIASAEADRLDPGWRWDELEAKRPPIPDGENSVLCVIAAHQRLPRDWPTWRSLDRLAGRKLDFRARSEYERTIRDLQRPIQLNAQQTAILKAELAEAEASLTEARKLADLPHGRLPPGRPSSSPLLSINPHIQEIRKIVELLCMDALVRAQDGDLDGALASCRGILNAGRGIGDEPDHVAQLVRLGGVGTAIWRLERVLAQGKASANALGRMRQLLEDEAEVPTLLTVLRGERASVDRYLQKVHDGTIPLAEVEQLDKLAESLWGLGVSKEGGENRPPGEAEKWYAPGRINRSRACFLRYSTDLVEICKRTGAAPQDEYTRQVAMLKKQPAFLQSIGAGKEKLAESCWRYQAMSRCAAVALAVECYRQANRRWPESLTELVPNYIGTIPLDPYDGRPLRYFRAPKGVGVYSIGPDRKDDGGDLRDPSPTDGRPGSDMGFRLWNPRLRRWPPSPEQPLDALPGAEDADDR